MTALKLHDFLSMPGTILDVRSPAEFSQGRIPGSISFPLFSNEERALIGTLYKQQGKDQAVHKGLEIVGPKLAEFVTQARQSVKGVAKVHCWRGGMRSASLAWLLNTAGVEAVTLAGGYKSYRRWALSLLDTCHPNICLIGGLTGSGKTRKLHMLRDQGEQILDLEALACHRGSSFGSLGQSHQPTNEQFENEIALELSKMDPSRTLWIEDESRMIGRCKVPDTLFSQMRSSPLYIIDCPLEERLHHLMQDYTSESKDSLIECTRRLQNRIGGAKTEEIVKLIENDNLADAIKETLTYYDKAYKFSLSKRTQQMIYADNGLFCFTSKTAVEYNEL